MIYFIGDHDDTSRVLFYGYADIPSEVIEPLCRFGTCGDVAMRCYLQGVVMPRRKKKYMLLRGKFGSFIVVERRWYDYTGIAKKRGSSKAWWIVAESDDHGALQKMAELTGDEVSMLVKHTYEEELTNVRTQGLITR